MNARARERRRRRGLQGIFLLRKNRSLAVNRIAEPVQYAPEQLLADLNPQASARSDDLAAGSDALHFTDWHEEHATLAKADHLRGNRRHP